MRKKYKLMVFVTVNIDTIEKEEFIMTPKERAVAALTLKIPDQVPTFELEFQLEEEMFGKKFYTDDFLPKNLSSMSRSQKEKKIYDLAEYMVDVYCRLEYSIMPCGYIGDFNQCGPKGIPDETKMLIKYMRSMVGNKYMLHFHGDGTFAIPNGDNMYEFAYSIADDPEGMKEKAQKMADDVIERNKIVAEAGVDCLILCSDYCYNSGPFLSPSMFEEYIQPFLALIIEEARRNGLYTIKHTDGNIMPIIDMIVDCKPHAIHSIDPMAGMDIKEIKKLIGHKVALCGNVNCALMQTGTEEEVIESAKYCLTHAKPNGGYIFCTSNIPFKGLPPERYAKVLDVWRSMRAY